MRRTPSRWPRGRRGASRPNAFSPARTAGTPGRFRRPPCPRGADRQGPAHGGTPRGRSRPPGKPHATHPDGTPRSTHRTSPPAGRVLRSPARAGARSRRGAPAAAVSRAPPPGPLRRRWHVLRRLPGEPHHEVELERLPPVGENPLGRAQEVAVVHLLVDGPAESLRACLRRERDPGLPDLPALAHGGLPARVPPKGRGGDGDSLGGQGLHGV